MSKTLEELKQEMEAARAGVYVAYVTYAAIWAATGIAIWAVTIGAYVAAAYAAVSAGAYAYAADAVVGDEYAAYYRALKAYNKKLKEVEGEGRNATKD